MYVVLYRKSVEKDLRKLPKAHREAIIRRIQTLAVDPRPAGVIKLRGSDSLYRMRHTEYRIIYRLSDGELTVLVIKVGHRREIYRDI